FRAPTGGLVWAHDPLVPGSTPRGPTRLRTGGHAWLPPRLHPIPRIPSAPRPPSGNYSWTSLVVSVKNARGLRVQGTGRLAGRSRSVPRVANSVDQGPGGASDDQNRAVLDGIRIRMGAWHRGIANAGDPHRRQGGCLLP